MNRTTKLKRYKTFKHAFNYKVPEGIDSGRAYRQLVDKDSRHEKSCRIEYFVTSASLDEGVIHIACEKKNEEKLKQDLTQYLKAQNE